MNVKQAQVTYVLSDLHLAEGNLGKGITNGTENFFSDLEFVKLINHLVKQNQRNSRVANLTINGDFVDFIRITEIPESTADFATWQSQLDKVNAKINVDKSLISDREKKYGLRTNDYKSVWKLYLSITGHKKLFLSLAYWVSKGNSLTIIVGNHDPEWYWELVQQYLIYKLHELGMKNQHATSDLEKFKNQISFHDTGYSPYDGIRIEHGHNYERTTRVCSKFELDQCLKRTFWKKTKAGKADRDKELFLPFGSFFNRYLINKVEIIFPYVDNLKTNRVLINALIEEDFSNVWKILKNYGAYAILVVLKSFWKSLAYTLMTFAVTILPIIVVGIFVYNSMNSEGQFLPNIPGWLSFILEWLRNLAPILLRYILKKLFLFFNFTDKPLQKTVIRDFKSGRRLAPYQAVFVGHNHIPEIIQTESKKYINTGTWTSKYVFKYKSIQSGTIYAVGRIKKSQNNQPSVELLEWKPAFSTLQPLTSFKKQI